MPYSLSRKQLDRLRKGYPVSVALPPPASLIETLDDVRVHDGKLLLWAVEQFADQRCSSIITRAKVQTIWVDCVNPLGGLTEFYGGIVPDISTHSKLGLPPIPVSVVVCEITPIGYSGPPADRIQWPGSYLSPSGYGYGGTHETRYGPA